MIKAMTTESAEGMAAALRAVRKVVYCDGSTTATLIKRERAQGFYDAGAVHVILTSGKFNLSKEEVKAGIGQHIMRSKVHLASVMVLKN